LTTPDRDAAFFRLLLLGGAWGVYALIYRYHAHAERAMPYLAAAAVAVSIGSLFVQGLPIGWLWDRNVTADVLLLLTPWLRGPVMLLGWVAVALTGSRGAWMGLVGALLWLIWRPRWYVWALVVGALAVGLVFIRPATAIQRVYIWQNAARLFLERPLIGLGIGATTPIVWDGRVLNLLHAHNILLDALLNGGVFLGVAWAAFLWAVIRLIVGPPGSRARLGLLAVILHGMVDCEIWTPAIVLMAVNLALLVRFRESENRFCECTDSDPAAPGVAAAA
jgi:O-antigen ligase